MNFETNLPLEPNVTPLFERQIPDTQIDLRMASDHLRKSYAEVERERLAAVALGNRADQLSVQKAEKPPTPQELVEREGVILLSVRRRRALGANAIDHDGDQNIPKAA